MAALCHGDSTPRYRPAITLSVCSATPTPTTPGTSRPPLSRRHYSSSPVPVDCPSPWSPSHPLSPPESASHRPPELVDQVCSFIRDARFNGGVREITAHRAITGVSAADYNSVISTLQKLHYNPRITYLSHRKLLIITLPGRLHENIAIKSQIFIRQALYDQGFYPPSLAGDIDNVYYTGAADVTAEGSKLQADGSLHMSGQKKPFLVIEVADSQSFVHAHEKAVDWLKLSGGMVRFVVIIKLVRKTAKELKEESLKREDLYFDGHSEQEGQDDEEEEKQVQQFGKRAAPDQHATSAKRPRNLPRSTPSPPPPPSSPPLLLPTRHSHATVTVLTSAIVPHPRLPDKKKRTITTAVDNLEVWPCCPAPQTALTFSWDDMNMESYPEALKGRVFTITWDWLHELLVKMIHREQAQEEQISGLVPRVDGDDLVESSSSADGGQGGSEEEEESEGSAKGESDSSYEP